MQSERVRRGWIQRLGLIVCSLTLTASAFAQQSVPAPRLDGVFPFSGQAGGKPFEVVVNGDELDGEQQLLFTHPGIKAEPVMIPADRFYPNPRPKPEHFTVTVAADVPVGAYEVRLANKVGTSNARRFVVGAEPESVEVEPNNDPKTATPIAIGSVVSGTCDPQKRDFYRFAGKKGQRLIISCMARRADSLADPALVLYDSTGNVIRRAHDAGHLETVIDFTPPADADYFISVNDFVYGGGPKHPYRLSVGTGPWIDFIDPPVAVAGTTTKHTVYGRNLPGGTPASAEMNVNGEPMEKVEVSITSPADPSSLPAPSDTFFRPSDGALDAISYRLPGPNTTFSNPLRVAVVRGSVIAEQEPNDTPDKAQLLTLPATVLTRSNPRGDRDWFGFDAKKGDKLWVDVVSRRFGQPTDPNVLIQRVEKDKDGKQTGLKDVQEFDDVKRLTENVDDPRFRFETDDVSVLFTAPEDGDYRLMLRDLFSAAQAGPNYFQLLTIRKPEPDFALHAHVGRPDAEDAGKMPAAPTLRKGGSATIEIAAFRREGFDGEIKLTIEGLPAGVTSQPTVMGPWADYATIVLQAAPDAANWTGAIHVVGKASINDAEQMRVAAAAEPTVPRIEGTDANPRAERLVAGDLTLCVRDDITAQWSASAGPAGKVWRMARAGKIELPVNVTRNSGFTGDVKLDPQVPNQFVRTNGPVTFGGSETEKKLTLEIDSAAKTGSFTMYLRGMTPMKYSRSPEVVKQAGEDEKRIREMHEKDRQLAQKSQQDREQAEQKSQQAKQKADEAEQNRVAAMQHKTEADQQEKATAEKMTAAKTAVDEATRASQVADAAAASAQPAAADAAKQAAEQAKQQLTEKTKALTEATKQHDEAAAAAKTMTEKFAAATQMKTDADAAVKLSQETVTASTAAEKKAQADEKASAAAQQVAEQRNGEVRRFADARDVRVYGYASPALIEVVDSPWTAKLEPAEISVKAGAPPTEVTATLTREFDFNGDVRFELTPPEGAGGLGFGEKGNTVAAGQNSGKLTFRAEESAKPGEYTWTLRGRYTFNNRGDLTVERPLKVTILPADPKPK